MSLNARFSELPLHTTRVVPGGPLRKADASERAFGTLPPAAGDTALSGCGSGQYAVRSTCANATAAAISATPPATTSAAIPLRIRRDDTGAARALTQVSAALAAATRATGTRNGEQLT